MKEKITSIVNFTSSLPALLVTTFGIGLDMAKFHITRMLEQIDWVDEEDSYNYQRRLVKISAVRLMIAYMKAEKYGPIFDHFETPNAGTQFILEEFINSFDFRWDYSKGVDGLDLSDRVEELLDRCLEEVQS